MKFLIVIYVIFIVIYAFLLLPMYIYC